MSIDEDAHTSAPEPVLRISDVSKSFGPVRVLSGISVDVMPGKVVGIVGENGAGKSTLMKCVCGLLAADAGSITVRGRRVSGANSVRGDVYMVPQEFTLIGELSVSANVFLGREPERGIFLDSSAMKRRTSELLDKIGAGGIDPDEKVSSLGAAAKQKVEIAKAFLGRPSLLIFDEPTTVLSRPETESLFRVIRDFKSNGGSVVYISHKLDEVCEICDEIAVLRDGVLVWEGASASTTPGNLVAAMVGRPISSLYPPKNTRAAPGGEYALEVSDICDAGGVLHGVSMKIKPGEIAGLAGLAGAGRTEFAETVFGARPRKSGSVRIFGREVDFGCPAEALSAGLAYLPEDRQGSAVIGDFSLADNLTLCSLRKRMHGPFINFCGRSRAVRDMIGKMNIKCSGEDARASSLSGGNQQKAAIAKLLDTNPRIFIFDEPTRGVDVGARAEIYSIVHRLADDGMAVLVISSDLDEIIGNCTRVMVMRDGCLAGEVDGEDICERKIMEFAMGVSQNSRKA